MPWRLRRLGSAVIGAAVLSAFGAGSPTPAEDALPAATVLLKRLDVSASAAGTASATLRQKLTPADASTLKTLGATFARTGDAGALSRDWQRFVATRKPLAADINALIQWVLRESYLQSSEDLKSYAEKVKYFNAKKKALRQVPRSLDDDAQLANVDLQNALQKQQQTLQMMSNISKMLHDTAMAVIRKIGG